MERFERIDVDEGRSKVLVGDRFCGVEGFMIRFS